MGINGRRLFLAESVPGFGAPLSILIYECFLRAFTDTLPMPRFFDEIGPFLVSIHISGCAFEQRVDTRKRPIQQRDQIVFEIDLRSYVLVVLAAARFERLPDLISGRVTFKICPTVKTVIRNFHSVQLVCLAFPDGVVAIFVNQQRVHGRDKKARIVQHLGDRLPLAPGVLHDDPCFSGQLLQKAGQFP